MSAFVCLTCKMKVYLFSYSWIFVGVGVYVKLYVCLVLKAQLSVYVQMYALLCLNKYICDFMWSEVGTLGLMVGDFRKAKGLEWKGETLSKEGGI